MIARTFRDIWSLVMFFKFSNCTRLRLVQFWELEKHHTCPYITKCTRVHTISYTYFHFYHEISNSRVPIYEYGLMHCLTDFGLLELHWGFWQKKDHNINFFFSYKIKTDLFRTLNCIIKLIPSRLCNCKQCTKFESCAIWQAAWSRFTRQMISLL